MSKGRRDDVSLVQLSYTSNTQLLRYKNNWIFEIDNNISRALIYVIG